MADREWVDGGQRSTPVSFYTPLRVRGLPLFVSCAVTLFLVSTRLPTFRSGQAVSHLIRLFRFGEDAVGVAQQQLAPFARDEPRFEVGVEQGAWPRFRDFLRVAES